MKTSLLALLVSFSAAAQTPASGQARPLSDKEAASSELPPNHPSVDSEPASPSGPDESSMPPGHPANGDIDPHALLQQLDTRAEEIRKKPKNFDIAYALGNLYYENARYSEAIEFFAEAVVKAQPAFHLLDELKGKVKGPTPSEESAGCAGNPALSVEQKIGRAEDFKKSGKTDIAWVCARSAEKPALDALTRRGTAFLLKDQIDDAIEQFNQVLARDPAQPEANYRLGAVLFDAFGESVSKLKHAKQLWQKFLEVAPADRRAAAVKLRMKQLDEAIANGGVSKASLLPVELLETRPLPVSATAASQAPRPSMSPPPPGSGGPIAAAPPFASGSSGPAPITPELSEAIANTPRGPEFEAGLKRNLEEGLQHLIKREYQEAVQSYRSVLPYEPNNSLARSGMAAALIGRGSPMADRIFSVAAEADRSSIETLAQKLKAGGNDELANSLLGRLK